MLIVRTGGSHNKHYRNPRKRRRLHKLKPLQIFRDHETMRQNELARENALQAYNEGKGKGKSWQNGIIDTAEATVKRKISVWRATFERAYDKMNSKISELLEQVEKSDKRANDLNMGFYNNVTTMHKNFYTDLAAMSRESEKRNVGFMKKAQAKKFVNDLRTLTNENEKRNVGFQCQKRKDSQASKFKKMCEESRKRNDIYLNKRKVTELDRMNKMNQHRTASFMDKRPDSKFDAAMSMNENRTSGFTNNRRPLTKLDEITKWNCQRNAVFHLRA